MGGGFGGKETKEGREAGQGVKAWRGWPAAVPGSPTPHRPHLALKAERRGLLSNGKRSLGLHSEAGQGQAGWVGGTVLGSGGGWLFKGAGARHTLGSGGGTGDKTENLGTALSPSLLGLQHLFTSFCIPCLYLACNPLCVCVFMPYALTETYTWQHI